MLSESSRQVHLPRKQCLINRDRHQNATSKGMDSYDRLPVIRKSDLTDKIKRSFFQTTVVLILLYGCTTWTLRKRMEKKLDDNYTRVLWAILNKSWRQHHTKQQLYIHLLPITKTTKIRRTKHAGHCRRSRDELISNVLLLTPHRAEQRQDDQLEPTWTTGRGGERGTRTSALMVRHDKDFFNYLRKKLRTPLIKMSDLLKLFP